MHYQLELTLRRAEGVLSRVLGTAERRGFHPLAVAGNALPEAGQTDGERWHLRLTVAGERPAEALRAQLAKLHDCLAVEVAPCR